jgi:hypothetical protein
MIKNKNKKKGRPATRPSNGIRIRRANDDNNPNGHEEEVINR